MGSPAAGHALRCPGVPEGHCKWRFRRLLDADRTRQLIVGAATRFDRTIQIAFTAYVQLRHHEVTTRTGRTEESSTLGEPLTPAQEGAGLGTPAPCASTETSKSRRRT